MVRGVGPPPTPPPPNQVEPPAVMLKPEPEADLVHPPTVLHVFLIRASDLPMMDYNWMTRKGSSDPVVSLKIDSQDKVCKSKVQSRTVNPVWNEHFALPSDDGSDALVLTIDDYDMLSANDFMGAVRVPVGSLAHREFRKETFPVTDARGELKKKGTWGTVELCLRWVYDADFAFPIPAELAAPEPPELAAKEANAVRIFLIRGRNLPIADKNLLSSGGSSDPMVTFASGKQVLESTVVKKSLSPIWEETFELRADDVDDAVAAVVDDWDLMSGNDFMGKFWIELQPLAARTLVRRWYALRPEGAARKAGASAVAGKQARAAAEDASLGKVELACRWLHLKQFDLPPPDVMVADERYPDEKPNALHVFLIRGKNLPVMDKNVIGGGGSSDPLVTVSIEDERKTSKVKKKNLEPIWSEHFEFPVEDLSDSLKVVCDDWDLLSGNDFMGQLDVPIRLFADRELHRQWWFLCNEHGREHTDLGKLEFAFRLYHNPAYVFPTPVRFLQKDVLSRPANVLLVHVVRGKGLPIMDPNMMSKGGSSDPFVKLAFSGFSEKTAVKKQTLAPIFEETFAFPAEMDDEVLELEVCDHDVVTADDFMGRLSIPLKHHKERTLLRGWFALADKDGRPASLGRLELCVRWVYDVDYDHAVPEHMAADEDPALRKKPANCVLVFLVAAKNLPVMDKNLLSKGGSSDPLATLVLEGEQVRSTTKKKTLCPLWKEHFQLAAHALDEVLHVTVDDWDAASGNDFMGTFSIPVDDLEGREVHRRWYDLEDEKRMKARGRVEVACRFVYRDEYAVELPKDFVAPEKSTYERPNLLKVFLIRARGLPALDSHPFALPSSDPTVYLKIQFEETHESTTKWKSLAPTWCETFTFPIEDLSFPLDVTAVDKDDDDDEDLMGSATVDLKPLRDRKVSRRWYKLRGDAAHTRRAGDADYGGKVELALRWVHEPKLVAPLPDAFVTLDPKLLKKELNALRILVIRAKTHADAPNDLEVAARLNMPRAGRPAYDAEHVTDRSHRTPTTKFTSWWREFLIPIDEEMKKRDALTCVVRSGSGVIVGTVNVPWDEVRGRSASRAWHLLHSHSKNPEPQELELAALGVHDRALESEREFRLHSRRIKKETDERRGYKTTDTVQLVPVGDGLERFFLRIKFLPGIYGQLRDSYCCMSKALLLKDRRGEWAVFDCPTQVDFRRTFPKNLRDFIQTCFESGYELEGEGNVTKRLSSAIYNRDDITLYLDAPGELYDFFEEQLFDFFAR